MININFDNPYYLLIAIPLILLIVIPYAIAINKDNRTRVIITTFILHLVMVCCVSLATAGLSVTAVITKTEVFVVADVSYSANRNLDEIDEYIQNVSEELPDNSKLGVVCFGEDQQLLTQLGKKPIKVENATVDDSSTNIAAALEYTTTLFSEDVIKHIVLITDGKQTSGDGATEFIAAVQALEEQSIYIDAIYVDNNIPEDVNEVQISAVDYPTATYLGNDSSVNVMLYSNSKEEAKGFLRLYRDGAEESVKSVTLVKGYNLVSFSLNTATAGDFQYEIKVEMTTADLDSSAYNNSYLFTQKVSDSVKVLLVTRDASQETAVKSMFDENVQVDIDTYGYNSKSMQVPCTVEQLCKYDEIIISDINILELENYNSFVTSAGVVVDKYGKSLTTFGNLEIQNKEGETAEELSSLEQMLPVTFSNVDREEKLLGIVIDASRSMDMAGRLLMAKSAAKQVIALLDEGDWVSIICFSGDSYSLQSPTPITEDRTQLYNVIDNITTKQGTYIGSGLSAMYTKLNGYTDTLNDIEVMLISDGMSFTGEAENPTAIARSMRMSGIHTSCINTGNDSNETGRGLLNNIRLSGGGHYYAVDTLEDVDDLVMSEIADDIMETVVEKPSPVIIASKKDELVNGIESFSDISGYVNGKEKTGATLVLKTTYTQEFETDEEGKTESGQKEVPLCAYWYWGHGRVTTFTSTLTGAWVENFRDANGLQFFENLFSSGIPKTAHNVPFETELTAEHSKINISLAPATIKSGGKATVTLIRPDGTEEAVPMSFVSTGYLGSFYATETGDYKVNLSYSYDGQTYTTTQYYDVAYLPEYNAFTTYDASDLYNAVRNYGTVSENGKLKVVNDETKVTKYVVDFTMPLMIFVLALFVVDIIIRKLKWADIVSLFKKGKSKGGKV